MVDLPKGTPHRVVREKIDYLLGMYADSDDSFEMKVLRVVIPLRPTEVLQAIVDLIEEEENSES